MTDQTATKPRKLVLDFDKGRQITIEYTFNDEWDDDNYVLDAYAVSFSQMIVNGLTDESNVGEPSQP